MKGCFLGFVCYPVFNLLLASQFSSYVSIRCLHFLFFLSVSQIKIILSIYCVTGTVYVVTSKTKSLNLERSHSNRGYIYFSIQAYLVMQCMNFKQMSISSSEGFPGELEPH